MFYPIHQTGFSVNTHSHSNDSESVRKPTPNPQVKPGKHPAPHGPADALPNPAKRSLHVLCIDDDEQVLESVKACLELYGHRVKAASGGKHGLEMFLTAHLKSEPYDVVITDLNMPDMDGCETARRIKEECPHTPIVLISGLGANLNKTALAAAGVDATVNKPPRMRELSDLLVKLVNKA